MSANMTLNTHLFASQFSEFDGNRFCTLFIGQPSTDPKSVKGLELMKVPCDPDLHQQLPDNPTDYPLVCDIDVRLRKAGGNKLSQYAIAVHPVKTTGPADKASQSSNPQPKAS